MSQRERMLVAVLDAVADTGYAETTVADVVSRAGVSRRTFYEHFDDKLDCFLAAYLWRTDVLVAAITDEVARLGPQASTRERLRAGIGTYLERLAAEPAFARVLNVDVLGAGPRALAVREQVLERFVAQYRGLADRALIRGLVGGMAEMVQARLLAGQAETLPELLPVLERFALAVSHASARGGVEL